MQALHTCSFPANTPSSCPRGFSLTLTNHCSPSSRKLVACATKKAKAKGTKKTARQQQQDGQAQTATTWVDPRLQWANPEWLQQHPQHSSSTHSRPVPKQVTQPSNRSSSSGISQVAASARTRQQLAHTGAGLNREHRRLVDRLTYGGSSSSMSSSDEDGQDSLASDQEAFSSSSSSSNAAMPQPFQALGIDFGLARIGVAVRQATCNIPLMTLWPQQLQNNSTSTSTSSTHTLTTTSSSSSSSSGANARTTTTATTIITSSSSSPAQNFNFQQVAQVLLQTALDQGCDGFIVGLPIYDLAQQQHATTAVIRASRAAAGEAGSMGGQLWRSNARIRRFAQVLADTAAQYELPVLLVNEQQSTKQARAVRGGKAAYDIITLQELQQQQQQQQGASDQDSSTERQEKLNQGDPGRDAYAAALILSRYYNGLVPPLEVVQPRQQQQQPEH